MAGLGQKKGKEKGQGALEEETGRKGKLSLHALSKFAKLTKRAGLNLQEQKKNRALTFKDVGKAVLGFIRQEKILRMAIGPFRFNAPFKADIKRLKQYIKRTRAFSAGLSKVKDIEIKAPDAVERESAQAKMSAFKTTAMTVKNLKKMSYKKGGFIKPSSAKDHPDTNDGCTIDGDEIQEGEGRVGDRRTAPECDPYQQWARGRDMRGSWDPRGYMDRYRDYIPVDQYGRPFAPGFEQPWEGGGYEDEYYGGGREMVARFYDPRYGPGRAGSRWETQMYREQNYDYVPEEAMESYRREYENTAFGERYKLAPPGFPRRQNGGRRIKDEMSGRNYSPGDDRYLRLFDSSPEDQARERPSARDDPGYISGPQSREDTKVLAENSRSTRRQQRRSESMDRSYGDWDQRPRKISKSVEKNTRQHGSYSPRRHEYSPDPEDYRLPNAGRGRGLAPRMFERDIVRKDERYLGDYNENRRGYPPYPNAREEMAKLQSIAVYAAAMGGVNDSAGL